MTNSNLINKNFFGNFDDEIDLNKFYNLILRNKKFIGSITFLFFLLSCFYSFTLKRVWEGQFEIVLDATQNSLSAQIPKSLLKIGGFDGANNNDLNTEIGILQSPSVLMPIFNFVKENREPKDESLVFTAWRDDNVFIELKEDTSILKIAYRDTNKELILPVLNKISKQYQKYSGDGQRRGQELSSRYLKEQINIFRDKSTKSFKLAQGFAIDQDLIFIDLDSQRNNFREQNLQMGNNVNMITNIEIESARVNASNQLKKIDSTLEAIDSIGNDSAKLQFIISSINLSDLQKKQLLNDLLLLETQIVENSAKYTQNDPALKNLLEIKDFMISQLKKKIKSILQAQRMITETTMKAALRPKDILIQYKELLRAAQRDELTLVSLENQLRLVELNKTQKVDPWQLITEPNLLERPVAPSRRVIGLLGLISGFIVSLFASILIEKKSGVVYDIEQLNQVLPYPFFKISISEEGDLNKESLKLLKEYIYNLKSKDLSFFNLTDKKIIKIDSINDNFIDALSLDNIKKINFYNNIDKFQEFVLTEGKFVLVSIGNTKYAEIINLKERIGLFDIKISGVIVY